MLQLTINEKGGPSRTESFDKDEITIGRVQGNDIILPKGNISKRHSRIVLNEGKFVIVDLKSTNGTYVNGKKITGPQVIKSTDKVYIGDFTLTIEFGQNGVQETPPLRAADDEIDLFGGEAPPHDPDPVPKPAPGLLEDNFDHEFNAGGAVDPLAARLPQPSKRPSLDPMPPMDMGDGFNLAPEPSPGSLGLDPVPIQADISVSESPVSVPHTSVPTSAPGVVATAMPGTAEGLEAVRPMALSAPPAEPMEAEALIHGLLESVSRALNLSSQPLSVLPDLRDSVEEATKAALAGVGAMPTGFTVESVVNIVASRLVGIGSLVEFLTDDGVYELVVTADRRILIDKEGRLEDSGRSIGSEEEVIGAIYTLALMSGLKPDALPSTIDTRLRLGERFLASLPPFAFRGPVFSVRKTTRDFFTLEKLQEYDTINGQLVSLLDAAIRYRRNILLSTGPGVSGTATINALLSQVPADERITTAERGVELHLRGHMHTVAFDLSQDVSLEEVLRHAILMQTDRMVVSECLEHESAELVRVFSTYVEGGIASVGAISAQDSFDRLSGWLAEFHNEDLEKSQVRAASAFGLLLHERRLSDGSRRITEASELVVKNGKASLIPLFRFEPSGLDENGVISGSFVSTGNAPQFLKDLSERGEASPELNTFQATSEEDPVPVASAPPEEPKPVPVISEAEPELELDRELPL